jgi:hypothetical protein
VFMWCTVALAWFDHSIKLEVLTYKSI